MPETPSLRGLIQDRAILVLPGVFDGLSARLVQHAGYPAAFVTGAGLAESRQGVPDIGLMGFAEALDGAAMMAAHTDLLLIADADTGYGNAVNTYETVRRFERAGLAGIMIEDQEWPKRCGHLAGKSVIAADEMVQKVRAAVDARRAPGFVVEARTDAAGTHGLDEAIRRGNAYAKAGADLIFADALRTEDDIARFAREVDAPVCVNMGFGLRQRGTTPLVPACRLEQLGVAVVIYPRLLTSAALRGMSVALDALGEAVRADTVVERPGLQLSFEDLNDLMGLGGFTALEQRYAS